MACDARLSCAYCSAAGVEAVLGGIIAGISTQGHSTGGKRTALLIRPADPVVVLLLNVV